MRWVWTFFVGCRGGRRAVCVIVSHSRLREHEMILSAQRSWCRNQKSAYVILQCILHSLLLRLPWQNVRDGFLLFNTWSLVCSYPISAMVTRSFHDELLIYTSLKELSCCCYPKRVIGFKALNASCSTDPGHCVMQCMVTNSTWCIPTTFSGLH